MGGRYFETKSFIEIISGNYCYRWCFCCIYSTTSWLNKTRFRPSRCTHVVLEGVDTEQAQVNDDAMNRVVKIMEKRVNDLV